MTISVQLWKGGAPITFGRETRDFGQLWTSIANISALASRTYGTGRPHVGLCPKFLVIIIIIKTKHLHIIMSYRAVHFPAVEYISNSAKLRKLSSNQYAILLFKLRNKEDN